MTSTAPRRAALAFIYVGALQALRASCELVTPVLYTQVFTRGTRLLTGAPYWLASVLVGAALLLALRTARPAEETTVDG